MSSVTTHDQPRTLHIAEIVTDDATRVIIQVRQIATAFLDAKALVCRPQSLEQYTTRLRSLRAWMQRSGRTELDSPTITAYLTDLKHKGLSDTSVRNAYRQLKTFCRWAVEYDYLPSDPFTGRGRVPIPPQTRKRRVVYSDQDIVRLLVAVEEWIAEVKPNRYRGIGSGWSVREPLQAKALILLLCDSALRASEVCALRCGHLRKHEIVITGKGGHQGTVFITEPTREALEILARNRPDDAPLFRGKRRAEAATPEVLRGLLHRLALRADVVLPSRPLHDFRHYCARQLVAGNVPDLMVKQFMRHSQLSTTQLYTEHESTHLAHLHATASPVQTLLEKAQRAQDDQHRRRPW